MSNLAHPSVPEPARRSLPRRELGAVAHGAAAAGSGHGGQRDRLRSVPPQDLQKGFLRGGWGLEVAVLRLSCAPGRDGARQGLKAERRCRPEPRADPRLCADKPAPAGAGSPPRVGRILNFLRMPS